MGSVKMTDRGGMDAHLPVGCAGDGPPAAFCACGSTCKARGEIEGAGGGASTHLGWLSAESIAKSRTVNPFHFTYTARCQNCANFQRLKMAVHRGGCNFPSQNGCHAGTTTFGNSASSLAIFRQKS